MSFGSVAGRFCDPLTVLCLLDFSCSLKFCVASLCLKSQSSPPVFTNSPFYAFTLISSFLLQHCAVTSVLETRLNKDSVTCWWLSKTSHFQCLPDCSLERMELLSESLPGPQLGPRSPYLLQIHGEAQTPCHMMLDSTAPKKALLSIGGCQIIVER